jgi:uncharacterized surface protein with fasciclin (FAS1) repeats
MNRFLKNKILPLMLIFIALTMGCQKAMEYFPKGGGNTERKTIAQIVSMSDDFKLLKLALAKTGLLHDLNTKGPYTVFAPDNKAFAAAGLPDAEAIHKIDKETLKSILLYHVVGSKILAGQVPTADNTPVKTLNGKEIFVTKKEGKICINGVMVVMADIVASNGVIHVIDKVLMPPTGTIVDLAAGNPNFSLLVEAVKWASTGDINVLEILNGTGPLTVFAPTNAAFSAAGLGDADKIKSLAPNALAGILAYHVIAARVFSCNLVEGSSPATLNGQTVGISLTRGPQVTGNGNGGNPSNIIITDLVTNNGVVHVIDRVLLPQ